MNLSQVRYFKKLAEVQHYTRAAKELFISQPTLSNSISQLERELGIPLFERENRAVRLTRYGEEFYAYASQALQLLDKGVAIAHEHAGSLSGTIEIGTVYSIQGDYLPALMSAYRAACGTAVTTNVSQGLTLPLVEDLEHDRYEVVFAAHVPGKPKLTFVPVFEQRLVAIMHRRHPLAAADEVTFDDVHAAERLLSYPPQTPVGCEVARLLERHGIALAGPFYHDEITLASMVESTQGAVGLALDTIGLAPFADIVVKPLAGVDDAFHAINLVYKTSAFKTRALESFIAFARAFVWKPR